MQWALNANFTFFYFFIIAYYFTKSKMSYPEACLNFLFCPLSQLPVSCTPSTPTQPLISQGLASSAMVRRWHDNSEARCHLSSTTFQCSPRWLQCPKPVGTCLGSCMAPAQKHQVIIYMIVFLSFCTSCIFSSQNQLSVYVTFIVEVS